MTQKKRIVEVRNDENGATNQVRFDGNTKFTPVKRAIEMADRDEIENIHVSHTKDGKPYLRSDPDGKERNNLDHMAGDSK